MDEAARTLLKAARETSERAGLLAIGHVIRGESLQWFPWLGTRGLLTLELHARCDGLAVDRDELSITYKRIDTTRWRSHLESIARDERSALILAQKMAVKTFDKFDGVIAEELLDEANARDRLDLPIAKLRAEQMISALNSG